MADAGQDVLLVIVGPTASGKTALALSLAQHADVEVVSADSRTVYRWMDIGTAKPSLTERALVPHHLLDVIDPDESFTLADYQQLALAAIERIRARGRTPVLVGGAGLYVSAVCDGLRLPSVAPDTDFRARCEATPLADLLAELQHADPITFEKIDRQNPRRVIRALEVHHVTGVPFSSWQSHRQDVPFRPLFIGLDVDRAELYRRIDSRIDQWLASGLVEEVRGLLERGYAPSLPSMSGIGYRELAQVLQGQLSLEDATQRMKHATHAYARRQMTWFRREPRINWLAEPSPESVLGAAGAPLVSR